MTDFVGQDPKFRLRRSRLRAQTLQDKAQCPDSAGQGQTTVRECNACNFRFLSTCFLTTSYRAQCQENSFCGVTNYNLANIAFFAKTGCFESTICNQSLQGTGVLKFVFGNTTCCISNLCNGSFTAQAPHLAVLGLLSVFLIYIMS
ncbi:unnamed protein product [Ranitomeya imitator]|uniref:UPAR/Ly6 domain-containing protein n=1 Tax=Ranitomeya imitator TaxID=111125 RepID=A0ABN9MI24_9NEOB|nr:unnamed protein product [Ranitomeya imitator]